MSERPHVFVLGVSHRTAPVALRDRLLFRDAELPAFVEKALGNGFASEAVVLSTCNRSEIYAVAPAGADPHAIRGALEAAWGAVRDVTTEELRAHSYFHGGDEAVRHLFRVVGSLDSMVLGEMQILGQVKDAYQAASENRWTDFWLDHVFQAGFHAGKRIHAETAIHEGAVSVSYAAVELARKVLGDVAGKSAGLVGTGEMGELAAQHLHRAGVRDFRFFNRSPASAEKLAATFGGEARGLDELSAGMAECDIMISATGATGTVITAPMVREAARHRRGVPLFLIDIAAPADIAPEAGEVENTFLFTLDDLRSAVEENADRRREAARAAEAIVEEEVARVSAWARGLEAVPVLRKLRDKYARVAEREIERHAAGQPPEVRAKLEALGRGLLNKFLHAPTVGLKRLGEQGQAQRANHYAGEFFALDEGESDAEG
ncbi:MAG TPA: glutamyl-tRNA reductase [Fibrobacteria bacterium]|nr:glutamyl-tRNA reductase [Fibrobacteria bacterium]